MSLSQNIKRLRLEKEMTQEQLASLLGFQHKRFPNGRQARPIPTARCLFLLQMPLMYPLMFCSITSHMR